MGIITARLLLRPVTLKDAGDMYEYSKNPDVGPNAGWKPHCSIFETREVIRSVFLKRPNVWGIVDGASGKLIGSVSIVEDNKRNNPATRMLGYALSKEYWGKGIMTEAAGAVVCYGMEKLKLDLISAYCYPYNTRSSNVMKKLGFVYEGRLARAERCFDGRVMDHDCYALTAERYYELARR